MFTPLSAMVLVLETDLNPTDHTGLGVNTNQQIAALIGILLPLVVALITKRLGDSSTMKSVLLLALNVVNAFLTELLGPGDFVWQQALWGLILSFATGVVALYGAYKPIGASDALHDTFRKD